MDYRTNYATRAGSNLSLLSKGKVPTEVTSFEGLTTTVPPFLNHPSCSTEPTENSMPFELAMKREREYRRKLEQLRLQTPSNSLQRSQVSPMKQLTLQAPNKSSQAPLHSQVRPTGQLRSQNPSNSSQAPPHSQARPMKRLKLQTPSNSSQAPLHFQGRPMKQLKLQTPNNSLQSPLRSKFSPMDQLKLQTPSNFWQAPLHSNALGKKVLLFNCDICRVPCSSAFNLKQHFKGSKHKAKLKELEQGRTTGEENGKKALWCELCDVPCMNLDCLQQHLTGKKHLARLQATEDARQMRQEAEEYQLKNVGWEMNG